MLNAQFLKKKKSRELPVVNVRAELDKLEEMTELLRIEYEKYFTGLLPFAPEKLHGQVKRLIRRLWKAPFKKSENRFRLKTLEGRFNTLNTYWQRVLKEREEGTYCRDVFKADMRERHAQEDQYAQTAKGSAEKSMLNLFNVYKQTLENQTGMAQKLDFGAFRKTLVQRAKELKEKHAGKKISFRVVVQDGKVSIKARAK